MFPIKCQQKHRHMPPIMLDLLVPASPTQKTVCRVFDSLHPTLEMVMSVTSSVSVCSGTTRIKGTKTSCLIKKVKGEKTSCADRAEVRCLFRSRFIIEATESITIGAPRIIGQRRPDPLYGCNLVCRSYGPDTRPFDPAAWRA